MGYDKRLVRDIQLVSKPLPRPLHSEWLISIIVRQTKLCKGSIIFGPRMFHRIRGMTRCRKCHYVLSQLIMNEGRSVIHDGLRIYERHRVRMSRPRQTEAAHRLVSLVIAPPNRQGHIFQVLERPDLHQNRQSPARRSQHHPPICHLTASQRNPFGADECHGRGEPAPRPR